MNKRYSTPARRAVAFLDFTLSSPDPRSSSAASLSRRPDEITIRDGGSRGSLKFDVPVRRRFSLQAPLHVRGPINWIAQPAGDRIDADRNTLDLMSLDAFNQSGSGEAHDAQSRPGYDRFPRLSA